MEQSLCNIIFTRTMDFHDVSGCLKPAGHNDAHLCMSASGEKVEWEDDYECTCGCWNEDPFDPCAVYSVVN